MSYIDHLQSGSIQVGDAPLPPISTVDLWPSLDPTTPFSLQVTGINNFLALTNQIGLFNGVGVQNQLGADTCIGFGIDIGGASDAQPSYDSSALSEVFSSPNGHLYQKWDYNGTPLDLLHSHSDIRLKKNIEPLVGCLDKVLQLQGISFDWDKEVSSYVGKNKDHELGLIAQEVEKVIPEVVFETNVLDLDYQVKNVDYEKLIPILVEAIKEQQVKINNLEETVQELSTKLASSCSSCYD